MNEMQDTHKWNATLAKCYDVLSAVIADEVLDDERRHELVLKMLLELGDKVVGGTPTYFPKSDSIKRAIRDRWIWQAFNGRNIDQLAKQCALTERQVRSIIEQQRQYQLATVQTRLPF